MTTILSTRAAARLVQKHVQAYGATPLDQLLVKLDRYGVDADRADLAIRFNLVTGRLVRVTVDGQTIVRQPRGIA